MSEVILKFKVFSDLQSNWIVRVVSSEPFVSELLFSLCVSEKTNSALSVPSLFFPSVYKEENTENVKSWSLDMKHLHYPDKEATLIFSFVGAMDKEDAAKGSIRIKKCHKKWKKSTIVLTPPPPLGSFGLF